MGVEANSRQYYPHTSSPERQIHPGIVGVKGGVVSTRTLDGPGLGYQTHLISRPIFKG
jgi:hypothetical protein